MINIKSEILAKRKKNNEKAEIYNSVVKEYIEQIKDIIVYSGYLKMDYYEKEGLLKIDVVSNNERTKYHFSYNDIKRYLYLNNDDTLNRNMIENKLKDFVIHIVERENIEIKEDEKLIRGLRASKEVIDDACNIDRKQIEEVLIIYKEPFDEKKGGVNPIDFKSLIEREEDKKKVIYGLFDSILEANLEGIRNALDEKYVVNIQYSKSKANTLCIIDTDVINRVCYIEYERVNSHKSFEEYTKEEIEEYLQRIVVAFAMEYDK